MILKAIAPVFALIVLGHAVRRWIVSDVPFWNGVDRVAYWLLLPALLFNRIATMKVSAEFIGPYAIVVLAGFAAAFLFAIAASVAFGLPGPVASSVTQGASRHNTFIALAVTESLFGPVGQASAYLASSILIPVTNIAVVIAIVVLHQTATGATSLARAIARDIVRNPLIIAVALGVVFNMAGAGHLPVLNETTDLLGRAALPMVLLSIGASIRFEGLRASFVPLAISTAGKMLVFPAVVLATALWQGLGLIPASVAMIYASCATATSSYALARLMGGDAPLAATIVTVQTLLSAITMPLAILLARQMFS